MVILSILYIFLLITFTVFIIDLIPLIKDWALRIKMGRYQDFSIWNNCIINKGVNWLIKTPKIKVTDNTRLVIIDFLKGNYSKSAIQHWQEGALVLGLSEYLKTNKNNEVEKAILKFLDSKFDENGQWIKQPDYIDGAILAYAVMQLDFIDLNKYKRALDTIWSLIQEHMGEDGTVMYRKSMKNYRYVDTIGFICPFLVCYGTRYVMQECVDLAVKQINEYEKYGIHKELNIPCHAYKTDQKIPLGIFGWGRGLGWFAIGLIDSWNELPVNHKYKPELELLVKKFAVAIIRLQQNDGSWNWTVTRNESRHDSSATATLGWFLLNAAKIDGISKASLESSGKALEYLMTVTRRNGAIDFSQGDTKDIGVYSSLFNILPFTQGFSIRCINFFLKNYSFKDKKFKIVS